MAQTEVARTNRKNVMAKGTDKSITTADLSIKECSDGGGSMMTYTYRAEPSITQ
jgi:hypothetical protein